MKKLVIASLLLLVISQLLLPGYFSQRLETGLKQEFKSSRHLQAEINSFPALLMLTGHFGSVNLEGEGLVVDGLKIAKLRAEFADVKLKPTGEQGNKWQLSSGQNRALNLVFNEADLEDYLAKQLDSIKNLTLNLGPQQTVLSGVFKLLGNQIELKLAGKFQLKNNRKLIFIPEDLMVADLLIHEKIVQQLTKKIDFSLDLTQLPIPLRAEKVKVKKDKLLILSGTKE